MGTQILDLRKDVPIVVETPLGLIEITKPTSPRHRGKIVVAMPEGMKAYVGVERALEHARFVTTTSDGRTVPTYGVLVPTRGEHGELVGVQAQQPMRLSGSEAPVAIRLAAKT